MNLSLYFVGWVGMIVVGLVTFRVLVRMPAPYGRHHSATWGPTVSSRWGWLLMEAVSPLTFTLIWWQSSREGALLLGLWWLHYGYRGFIYPFLMKGGHKPMPWVTVGSAVLFNLWNGAINGLAAGEGLYFAGRIDDSVDGTRLWGVAWDPIWVPLGLTLFVMGMLINHWADAKLRALRTGATDGSYSIPRGGLYRWVSCPNYLGESLEWIGFAVVAWSGASLAFAIFTLANLVPRALAHHRWYQAQFDDYPSQRKALIPGIL